jgi:tetratricopeptide (TPR) repeat protein
MSQGPKKNTGLGKAAAMFSGTPVAEDSPALESASRPAELNDRWTVLWVCVFLAAITFVVFGQTLHHEFVYYDDNDYVYENPEVARGLTLKGIVWAFTRVHSANWHPLTWISHMLDCQLYGLNAGGHHLTNILLHTATAILLFLVLRRMTGAHWRSAFVAAVFAIHPLRVESVAWVAERKDVLSGVFFMLTIGAYVRYVRHPWSPVRYGLVMLLFALGLMCKPMLVTLPFVLLLLDYWPLGRVTGEKKEKNSTLNYTPNAPSHDSSEFGAQLSTLLLEKLPLFGLGVASGVVTIFAQTKAIQSFDQISLPLRVDNALTSYVTYLGQMFWPAGLAVLYPFATRDVGVSGIVLSLVLLAGISAGAFILRRHRYFLTGWLWYLIMLVPVIGILQVGLQARADRYTYLPQIGLYLLLTWAVADLCAGWRRRRVVLGGCATIILVALIFCARVQVSYWRNSESLWTHTLACTSDNAIAHLNFGIALKKKGRVGEAIFHFQKALQINPDYAEAHNNLGNALCQKGRMDEAIVHYQKALQITPNNAEVYYNLGNVLLKKGNVDEAITHYKKALQINPDYAEAHNNLGNALIKKGSMDEAIVHFQKALQINPDSAEAQNNLAWVLATALQASLRNGNKAVELAQQANQLAGGENPIILRTLAAAYAEAGRFSDAQRNVQKAMTLARTAGQSNLVEQLNSELKLYAAGLPFHQESK